VAYYRVTVLRGFEFRRKDTPVHKLDPRTKGVYVACATAVTLMFATPVPPLIVLLTSVALVAVARVLREWASTMRGVAFLSAFVFAVNYLMAPEAKLNYAVSMTLRLVALTSVFSVFFLTTSPEDFALALLKLGVPYEYTLVFTMALRFVPTLARDLQMIIDAQRSRGLELERGGLLQRVKRFLPILIPLIVYEIKRSFMIAEALEARAFGAVETRTFFYELRMRLSDWAACALSLAALSVVVACYLTGTLPSWLLWEVPS